MWKDIPDYEGLYKINENGYIVLNTIKLKLEECQTIIIYIHI